MFRKWMRIYAKPCFRYASMDLVCLITDASILSNYKLRETDERVAENARLMC